MPKQHFDTKHGRLTVGFVWLFVLAMHGLILTIICNTQKTNKAYGSQENIFESFLAPSPGYKESSAQMSESSRLDRPNLTSPHDTASEISVPKSKYVAEKKISAASTKKIPIYSVKQSSDASAQSDLFTPPIAQKGERNHPPPPYPKISRRVGEQGKVVLAVEIDIDGSVAQAMIKRSSGYERLDQSALKAIRTWRFIPGNKGGTPQKMWATIPINFVLE
jgi:TonB family protein